MSGSEPPPPVVPPPPPAPPPPSAPPPPPPPVHRRTPLILAAVAGFLIVFICAGYYIYASWLRPAVAPPVQQSETIPPRATPTPLPVTSAVTPEPSITAAPVEQPPPKPPRPAKRTQPDVPEETASAGPPAVPQQQAAPPPLEQPPPVAQPAPVQAEPQAQPPPQQPVTINPGGPMQRPYDGPRSGWIIWMGKLGKNETLSIEGATSSTGSMKGELPGVPVDIVVDVTNIGLDEEPSPRNGWKRLVLRSLGKHSVIRIHWTVK